MTESRRAALARDGAVVIPREIAWGDPGLTEFLEVGRAAKPDVEALVDYTTAERFVEDHLAARVNNTLGFRIVPSKMRYSDRQNINGGGAFHRDVIMLTETWFPAITALAYLDGAVFEFVPGSHRAPRMTFLEAARGLRNVRRVVLRPGDVLVQYGSVLHRGAFAGTRPDAQRRLVQLFECWASPAEHAEYAPLVTHVPGRTGYSGLVSGALRLWGVRTAGNLVGYLNAARGNGPSASPLRRRLIASGVAMLASEGTSRRISPEEARAGVGAQNVYVPLDLGGGPTMNEADLKEFVDESFRRPFMVRGGLLLAAVVAAAVVFVVVAKAVFVAAAALAAALAC
jgi:hypothetical protein